MSAEGILAGILGGAGAGVMAGGIASGLGSYKPLPTLDLTAQSGAKGATTSRPEVSDLLRRAFKQSRRQESLMGHLVDELAGGVIGAGTAQQVARAAKADADVGISYLNSRMSEGSHKIGMQKQRDDFMNELLEKGVAGAATFGADLLSTSSPDPGDAVEGSISKGLKEQVSPGELTAPRSMPNLRLQEAARKQGQDSIFGPIDLALDPGAAVLGMQPELGSVQAFDPDAPFGAMDPSVTGKYVSADSPLFPNMMIPENQMTRDESRLQDATEGATPVTRVRDAPPQESMQFQGSLGQRGEVGKGKPDVEMPESVMNILDKLDEDEKAALTRLLGG